MSKNSSLLVFDLPVFLILVVTGNDVGAIKSACSGSENVDHQNLLPVRIFEDFNGGIAILHDAVKHLLKRFDKPVEITCPALAGFNLRIDGDQRGDLLQCKALLENHDDIEKSEMVGLIALFMRRRDDRRFDVIIDHARRDIWGLLCEVERRKIAVEKFNNLIHVQIDRREIFIAGAFVVEKRFVNLI